MAAGFMTHVTCRLTAKNRDQLRNPTLGNRVWATFPFEVTDSSSVKRLPQRRTSNEPKPMLQYNIQYIVYTGWLKIKYPTGEYAISLQPMV